MKEQHQRIHDLMTARLTYLEKVTPEDELVAFIHGDITSESIAAAIQSIGNAIKQEGYTKWSSISVMDADILKLTVAVRK